MTIDSMTKYRNGEIGMEFNCLTQFIILSVNFWISESRIYECVRLPIVCATFITPIAFDISSIKYFAIVYLIRYILQKQ